MNEISLGDHYSELSVLGCKYRFHPDNPFKRRLIRGSILGGKILAAPIVLCLAVVAGAVCAGIGLPAYCCFMLVRQIKVGRFVGISLLVILFVRLNDEGIVIQN
jgi:hypothetical protein